MACGSPEGKDGRRVGAEADRLGPEASSKAHVHSRSARAKATEHLRSLKRRARSERRRIRGWRLARNMDFDSVEAFCLFIGYPKSGHTLVASLLNAHPDVVISHELQVLSLLAAGFTRRQLFGSILDRDRWFGARERTWSGFSYRVDGQWQGRHRTLRVIGDDKSGAVATALSANPALLDRLANTVGVPIRAVDVIRHPLDQIVTFHRRRQHPQPPLEVAVEKYFRLVHANQVVRQRGNPAVLDVYHEDFVADPRTALSSLCSFLNLDVSGQYLDDCARLVHPVAHQRRYDVSWDGLDQAALERASRFDFLLRYVNEMSP
jgi:hypothetical protein